MTITPVYTWYDTIQMLNPLTWPYRFSILKFRLRILFELYFILPLFKIHNCLKGLEETTKPYSWDFDPYNDVDDSIIEPQIKNLSKRLLADFFDNKHGQYLRRSLRIMDMVMHNYIRGTVCTPHNPTTIYNFICTSSLSFSCAPDGVTLDLTLFQQVPTDDTTRIHPILPGYVFKLDHANRTAKVYEKDKPVAPDHPDIAIVLGTALMCYTHSFIHFHLPTVTALFADQLMHDPKKKNSRMAKLLERHTRFTLVFNYAGHNMFYPVHKQSTAFPFCFRVTRKDFAFINIARTQHYYYLTAPNQGGRIVSPTTQYKDKPFFDERFNFHRQARMYYDYIDEYVRGFGLEPELVDEFVSYVNTHVPTIKIEDKNVFMSTIIWQVSAFHTLDHLGIHNQREFIAFLDPKDPWNVACSWYSLDTYVDPYAVPGQNELLTEHVDHVGLPSWDRICSSISF